MIYTSEHIMNMLTDLETIQMTINHLEEMEQNKCNETGLSILFYRARELELTEHLEEIQKQGGICE